MTTPVDAFNKFKATFLDGRKSIFTNDEVLTNKSIACLVENFINNGMDQKELSFLDKIKIQLIDKPKHPVSEDVRDQAIIVLAHAVWLWRLPPSNATAEGRLSAVNEILGLINEEKKVKPYSDEYTTWFKQLDPGFAATGTYYNTNKPFELAYLISFFEEWLQSSDVAKAFVMDEQHNEQTITIGSQPTTKSVAIKNALMYLLEPEQQEPILSSAHKQSIVEGFEYLLSAEDKKQPLSVKIQTIKQQLQPSLSKHEADFYHFFYQPSIRPLWDKNLTPIESNTIYYGAPGTGKTFLTRQAAKALVSHKCPLEKLEEQLSERIFQVQFHPSFSYEDFIDGLKPKLAGNNVELTLRNGVFKAFCIKATKSLIEFRKASKNQKTEPPKYYFIVDEINRADLSAVFGEVLSCLEEDKRIDFDEQGNLIKGITVATQNSYLIESSDDAVHTDKSGNHLFGIPSNIVFIGTMNDIDRSVDTFDFALRRRFTWIYKGFDEDALAECEDLKSVDTENYIASCKKLNKYIADDLGLGRSYEIGHAYFMKVEVKGDQVTKTAKEKLFDRHLSPLIEEYLRSEYAAKEIAQKLKEARSQFIGEEK